MKEEMKAAPPGKYLTRADREALRRQKRSSERRRHKRYYMVMVLLAWDGVLLYMIIGGLIDSVCGAVFLAVVSVYLGYHLK